MRTLKIKLDCGQTTCASEPGKFCRFLTARADGSCPQCNLFGGWRLTDANGDLTGWILRCQACLEAEVEKAEDRDRLRWR